MSFGAKTSIQWPGFMSEYQASEFHRGHYLPMDTVFWGILLQVAWGSDMRNSHT